MFRRTSACVSALIVLVLAGCQDSGPFGLDKQDKDVEKSPAFELFDGGWAAVHDPNRPVHNGGFESESFGPEWTATVGGEGVGFWKIGATDPSPFFSLAPHGEPLPKSGSVGVSASGTSGATLTLSQIVTLPPISLIAGDVITLAFQNRIKNFGPAFGLTYNWLAGVHDYQVRIGPQGGASTLLWSAAGPPAPGVPAPLFTGGGGSADLAPYEAAPPIDISDFADKTVELTFVIFAFGPLYVDLDDIEIFVVPGAGDPEPVAFDDLSVKKAKVNIHKPKRHDKKHDKKKKDKDEFEVEGRFTLGDVSTGIDPANEDVTIEFGGESFTILAGSFRRDRHDRKWRFRGKKPGITKVELKDNGAFKVKAKGLDLSEIHLPKTVTFTLTIGDDFGSVDIKFNKKGKFEHRRKHDDNDDDD